MWRMTRKLPDPGTLPAADPSGLVDEELTREVIGGYYYVYNTMGYGFVESVYAKALYIELRRRGLRVRREVTVTAFFENYPVGHFRIDLLVEDRLAVELKAGRALVPEDRLQLHNWLRASNLTLGLLFHFGPRPTFNRVISEQKPSRDPAVSAQSASSLLKKESRARSDVSEESSGVQ
jgi:GxxExxY protein